MSENWLLNEVEQAGDSVRKDFISRYFDSAPVDQLTTAEASTKQSAVEQQDLWEKQPRKRGISRVKGNVNQEKEKSIKLHTFLEENTELAMKITHLREALKMRPEMIDKLIEIEQQKSLTGFTSVKINKRNNGELRKNIPNVNNILGSALNFPGTTDADVIKPMLFDGNSNFLVNMEKSTIHL